MMSELSGLIRSRKSVRTFDGNPLSADDREKLGQYISSIGNPFGIPVEFVLLDADVAFGYSFERLLLYAWSFGIGTTWIGGTMKREIFEKAAGLKEGEMMPCVSPLGYPAKKRSVREMLMRKGVGADHSLPDTLPVVLPTVSHGSKSESIRNIRLRKKSNCTGNRWMYQQMNLQ